MLDPRFDTRPATRCDAAAAAYLRDNPGASQFLPDAALVNAAIRMIRLRLSRLPSGGGMFVEDLVEELKAQGLEELVIRWAIHQGRASCFWFIRWVTKQDKDEDGVVRHREGKYIQPAKYTPPCSVDLDGEKPMVFGKEKKPLSPKTQRAVRLLIDAYPDGLTTAESVEKFGNSGFAATLRELRKKDADWRKAIITPGKAKEGGEYRLAPDQ